MVSFRGAAQAASPESITTDRAIIDRIVVMDSGPASFARVPE